MSQKLLLVFVRVLSRMKSLQSRNRVLRSGMRVRLSQTAERNVQKDRVESKHDAQGLEEDEPSWTIRGERWVKLLRRRLGRWREKTCGRRREE